MYIICTLDGYFVSVCKYNHINTVIINVSSHVTSAESVEYIYRQIRFP